MKPPFAYYGGKTTLAPLIADLLPQHEHYVEPFAGSLAVLLAKRPSRAETVNDLDGDIMAFWRVVRDRGEELERACSLTPHGRGEWLASREGLSDDIDDLERARRVWTVLTQSRGNNLTGNGWRYRINTSASFMPALVESYARRISPAAERLKRVTLESRDAVEMIREYGEHSDVCMYVDPPYLGSTRTSGYRVEMTGDDAHTALAAALNECSASVVLSGYDAPLYTDLFIGWHRIELAAPSTLTAETDRVEVLWSNRPLGEPDLFDLIDGPAA